LLQQEAVAVKKKGWARYPSTVGSKAGPGRSRSREEKGRARYPSTVGSGRVSLLCKASLTRSPPL